MLGASSFWRMVIKGIVIIAAVVLDQLRRRMAIQAQVWPTSASGTRLAMPRPLI